MREPFRLYKRCEKKGVANRCDAWPDCTCDWYDRVQRDGARLWVHLPETAGNKAAAFLIAQEKRRTAYMVKEGLMKPPPKPVPTLGAYITAYLASDAATKQKTTGKLVKNLTEFRDAIGADVALDQVTPVRISVWRESLLRRHSKKTGGTLSRNTAQRMYNSIKGLFSHAVDDEALEGFVNPCAKLEDWSEDPAPRRLWQPDEQWLIDELPPLFRLPLRIGMLCGCRRAEALALTRHDLSPVGYVMDGSKPRLGWIALQRKKKKVGLVKVRVPIALVIVEELRKLLMSPFQVHVFGDPPPAPDVWSSLLTRELKRLGERYQIDTRGLCMHGTRHTATTTMQDMPGVSTQTAKNMGGWTSTRMVETYSSPTEASMQVAAMGLARQLAAAKKPKGLQSHTPPTKRRKPRRKLIDYGASAGGRGAK